MPPLTVKDWYIGCALQGLLAHSCEMEIEGDDIMPLSDDEKEGLMYGDLIGKAFGIADAIMMIRKERAGEN